MKRILCLLVVLPVITCLCAFSTNGAAMGPNEFPIFEELEFEPMAVDLVERTEPYVDIPEIAPEQEVEMSAVGVPKYTYFDVPLDKDLQYHIFKECEARDVDPAIIIAMIERESNFNPSAVGDSGNSLGLMQIQPRWHYARMEKLGCTDLLDPYQNVTVGIDLFADYCSKGSVTWALMAYNGGGSYANRLSRQGIISDYAAFVLRRSESNG